jgi:DNA-binding LytR/AlgR family response regulator
VTDDGVGTQNSLPDPQTGNGFGTTQVRDRLATVYGTHAAFELIANTSIRNMRQGHNRLEIMTPTALPRPTALIAEDEPLLAAALAADLAAVWPELHVVATVGDGLSAVTQALALQPDVLFFDIRMPGQTGLDAAAELADAWPADGAKPFPALVFVTAYDHYALAAFDAQAVDYLVKPVQRERLQKCAQKIAPSLSNKQVSATEVEPQQHTPSAQQLSQIAALLAQLNGTAPPNVHQGGTGPATSTPPVVPLTVIQASVVGGNGSALVMVPVAEVLYFEAADKYIRVVTPEREVLIRTPLKELLPQLNSQQFWQIHRGTVVRADAITRATRDEAGKLWVHLRGSTERLAVSRLYAHLFKAM